MPALDSNEFVALLTASQRRLYAFICTLVIDRTDADEVLQETNLAVWEQAERFEAGTDFVAWACRVAYYKVLKLRDASKRHRVKLDAAVLELLATETIEKERAAGRRAAEEFEQHRRLLVSCVDELSPRHRDVLTQRYESGRSLTDIGMALGRNANAMAQLFHRIRELLRECVERKLVEPSG
jgi:RNA polymerase sigma-70 factor (ECF subfamily)